ncbi:MAG TPA: thrombospondin type 3 repeat-containing protein [Solirubrobacteraceae bacterium]|jgi:hypothetical protein
MRIRARATLLCVAVLAVLAAVPAAALADDPTMHDTRWPGSLALPGDWDPTADLLVPDIISPGICPPIGQTATFTFSYADKGVVLGADGRFAEHGSFTIVGTEEDAAVTDYDSTFSASSPNGSVEGERHITPAEAARSGVTCEGTSDAHRGIAVNVQRLPTELRITTAAGQATTEVGWAFVGVFSFRDYGQGLYISWFRSDQDQDGWDAAEDNCPNLQNFDQADSDGDGVGDDCETGDSDGDGVFDLVDNCVDAPNPNQANADGDGLGDACDADDDDDGVLDVADNCRTVANAGQRDDDEDGAGDACDGTFSSTDGFAGGGGKLAGSVYLSIALHSRGGDLNGSGHLADGATNVKLLDLTGLRSDGNRAVGVGSATVDRGGRVPYRIVVVDATNTFDLTVGDRHWSGALSNGNLVVH